MPAVRQQVVIKYVRHRLLIEKQCSQEDVEVAEEEEEVMKRVSNDRYRERGATRTSTGFDYSLTFQRHV